MNVIEFDVRTLDKMHSKSMNKTRSENKLQFLLAKCNLCVNVSPC